MTIAHVPINSTQEQRDNLKKLADYLMSFITSHHFDMTVYAVHAGSHVTKPHLFEKLMKKDCHKCRTVACALGYAPMAGIQSLENETWGEYSYRVFGLIEDNGPIYGAWEWCFSHGWSYKDNTPQGAAKRILYMLEHGCPRNVRYYLVQDDAPVIY